MPTFFDPENISNVSAESRSCPMFAGSSTAGQRRHMWVDSTEFSETRALCITVCLSTLVFASRASQMDLDSFPSAIVNENTKARASGLPLQNFQVWASVDCVSTSVEMVLCQGCTQQEHVNTLPSLILILCAACVSQYHDRLLLNDLVGGHFQLLNSTYFPRACLICNSGCAAPMSSYEGTCEACM